MESYDSILKRMTEKYEEESGSQVEAVSDIGLRLQVLAGELYRAQGEMEWLRRQISPFTASGAQLELHGAQRGVPRKEATFATGRITFSRSVAITFDIIIPKGTVCASSGEEAVEYETTEDGTLAAGTLAVVVPAKAMVAGAQGNAAEGYINTLVTPVTGIKYASNRSAFTGGADKEPEAVYRERVAAAYTRPVVLGNAGYYEEIACGVPGISSAQAVADGEDPGSVTVYLWGDGAAPDADTIALAQEELEKKKAAGATLTVQAATSKKINQLLKVVLPEGLTLAEVKAVLEPAMKAWMLTRKVGDAVRPADIIRLALDTVPSLTRVEMTASMMGCEAAAGVIPVAGTMTAGQLT